MGHAKKRGTILPDGSDVSQEGPGRLTRFVPCRFRERATRCWRLRRRHFPYAFIVYQRPIEGGDSLLHLDHRGLPIVARTSVRFRNHISSSSFIKGTTVDTNGSITRLQVFYQEYVERHDTSAFLGNVSRYYSQSTLLRLAFSPLVEVRRGVLFALGFLGDYEANAVFGRLLHDEDRSVRLLAENGIKNVWTRAGTEEQRRQLRQIMRCISSDHFTDAVQAANVLLDETPSYAEARNQRGIALFALEQYEDAIRDCAKVLEINPYHFGAAIGMGHAYQQLDEPFLAICSFRHALNINPNLENAKRQIAKIEKKLRTENG